MMKIDLIRHGEIEGKNTYCGVTDHALTDVGWQQMIEACDKGHHWEAIISSPLIRCRKFAEHLSVEMNIPLKIDSRWQEMNFGDWDGLTALEVIAFDEQNLANFWTDPYQYCPTNGESLKAVETRVLQAWKELMQMNKPVLVIAHGGPIRIVHCHITNHPIERLMDIEVPYADLRDYSLFEET